MTEHTKLPWSTHFVSATGLWEVLSAESEVVATCNDYAAAQRIVLACNAHKELLERLNKAMCPYCLGPCGKRDPDQHHCSWCDETRAAIAKATGGVA